MDEKAVRGVPWTLLTYAGTRGVTLVTTIVLARLLAPSDFGLVALALLVVQLLALFNDAGLVGALIVRTDLYDQVRGTVLTLMLALGATMAVLGVLLAGPVSALFGEPRLEPVLAVLALTLVPIGHNWFFEAVLQRELEFRRRFIAYAAETATFAGVALVLAAFGAGVWALVAAHGARTLAFGIALQVLTPYRVRPRLDLRAARPLFGESGGFLAQGGFAFLAQNADYLAVGRVLGASQLGFYSLAYRLSELPYLAIADPVAKVTFPAFARIRERRDELRRAFIAALGPVALAACPLGVLLSATADPLTRALFGERWLPMIGPLAVLGIWAAIRPIEATVGWLMNSVGQARVMGIVAGCVLVPMIPILILLAEAGGMTAVAWGMAADVTLSLAVRAWLAHRRAGVRLGDQWRTLRPVVAACVLAWLAARGVALATDGLPAAAGLVLAAVAGIAAYLAAVAVLDRALLRGALERGRRAIRRGAPAAGAA